MRVWRIKRRASTELSIDDKVWWLADSLKTPKQLNLIIKRQDAGGVFLDAVGEIHGTGESGRILIQLKQPTDDMECEFLKLNLEEQGIRIIKKEV